MKKLSYLIVLALILGLVLTGCSLLSNISQVPATGQSGIAYLTKSGLAPDPSLVGLWHFDEGSGTTAFDSSVYDNNGTIIGATWEIPGKFGSALNFDGTNDYVGIANDTNLNITQGTWEAWIKFDAKPSDVGHPMNPLAKTNQYWIHGSLGDQDSGTTDAIVAKIRIGGTRYCAKTNSNFITAGEWYHVAGTYDGGTLKLYVNGILEDSNTAPNGDINIGTPIVAVGTWSTLIDYFCGTIDEVRIYDNALSQETIKGHAAGIYGFNGLLAPYAPPEEKTFKVGRTIPLKWQYTDPAGDVVDSDGANPKVEWTHTNTDISNGTLDEEVDAPGTSGLQYDALAMTWQFNWQTKDREVGTYAITITSNQAESSPIFEIALRK